jgi:hypothetical protein
MSNTTAAAAAKREELLRKKEHWFAQRLAAQEREKFAAENIDLVGLSMHDPSSPARVPERCGAHPSIPNASESAREMSTQGTGARILVCPGDEQVLDRITERITSRLREEVRSEVAAFMDPRLSPLLIIRQ